MTMPYMEREEQEDLRYLLEYFSEMERLKNLPGRLEKSYEFYANGYEALTESPGEFLGWCLFALLSKECGQTPEVLSPEEEETYDRLNELRVFLGHVLLMEPYCVTVFQIRGESDVEVLLAVLSRLSRLALEKYSCPEARVERRISEGHFFAHYGFQSE